MRYTHAKDVDRCGYGKRMSPDGTIAILIHGVIQILEEGKAFELGKLHTYIHSCLSTDCIFTFDDGSLS
jgi:hypothetical protein